MKYAVAICGWGLMVCLFSFLFNIYYAITFDRPPISITVLSSVFIELGATFTFILLAQPKAGDK